MNDYAGEKDDRGSVQALHPAGAVQSRPELRESTLGNRVQTAQERLRAVLSVISGAASGPQEAVRCGVAEADVERWRLLFIDSGRRGVLMCGQPKPQQSAAILEVQNTALKYALRMKLAELKSHRQTAHGLLGPFVQIERIRRESEITISRFCALIGVSRRTYFRHLVLLRSGRPPRSERDSTSILLTCAQLVEDYLAKHPSYGHRRIHELMIADGHMVSAATVLRAIHVFQRHGSGSTAQGFLDLDPKELR